MVCSVTVLYPKTDDSTFDLKYYEDSHMPMVAKEFGPYNFHGYRVVKFIGTPDPKTPSPYSIQCQLEFKDQKSFEEALKNTAEKVLGDIPNFSNKDPILMVGDEVVKK